MRTTTERLLSVLLGCALGACHGEAAPDEAVGGGGGARAVTLPTGHRVTMRGDRPVAVDPPPGGSVAVRVHRAGEHVYVVPTEAEPLLQRGLVDWRQFDVAGLSRPGDPEEAAPSPRDEPLESHDLTVDVVDRDGAPLDAFVILFDLETSELLFILSSTPVSLPRSSYVVDVSYFSSDATGDHAVSMVQPRLRLDGPTTITMDARLALPVRIGVPPASARRVFEAVQYAAYARNGNVGSGVLISDAPERFGSIYTAQVGASAPPADFETTITSIWGRRGPDPDDRFFDSPYLYNTAFLASKGGFPTGFARDVAPADLAVVRHDYDRTAADLVGSTMDFGLVEGSSLAFDWGAITSFHLPFRRTAHYLAEGVEWRRTFGERGPALFPWHSHLETSHERLEAGSSRRERWNQAVLGPSMNPGDGGTFIMRSDGEIAIASPSYYGDQANHLGLPPLGAGSARLFRDGELVGESDRDDVAAFPVPPEAADYRLEVQSIRGGEAELSTQVDLAWTFRSSAGGDLALPTLAARFLPELDDESSAPAGEPFVLPIVISRQEEATVVPLKRLRIDVSYDRGQRWRRVTVVRFGDLALATYDHPRGSGGTVSLRARAADEADNTMEQVILDAYRLRASSEARP